MLSLIDSLVKDRQIIEAKMCSIDSEMEVLKERYKRLDRDRENLIHAIYQLEDIIDA